MTQLERMRLQPQEVVLPVLPEPGERFIKGPLPWAWICAASRLSGSALRVALALFHEQGLRKSPIVTMVSTRLKDLGMCRQAAYRALEQLAEAGLIRVVERAKGRRTVVRLLAAPAGRAGAGQPTGLPSEAP